MRGLSRFSVLVLLTALIVSVFAASAAAQNGTVSGTVTSAATGAGISTSVQLVTSAGTVVFQGPSNGAGGAFSLALAAGSYFVRTANTAGFVDRLFKTGGNIDCAGGTCAVTAGTAVTVTAGATTSGINFPLNPGGTITGTVTNSSTGVW